MKRILSLLLVIMLLPLNAMAAKSKKMATDLPPWTEETVRQYVLDYVEGKSMTRLYGYYDLQIRRYMPPETYASMLIDLHFLTGDFIELGSYRTFDEDERRLKTHVVHLCMEKQDLDLYFTHKNESNDWEVMAIEFVPAQEEPLSTGDDMQVESARVAPNAYAEERVSLGQQPYVLEGVLTIPNAASAATPVPACVLVHDFGALDRDCTMGQTKLFADVADLFGNMGIATIRYDKRTFAYPDAPIETVWDEVVEDALHAVQLLVDDPRIDSSRIVVVGVGMGAMLAPRIVSQSEGKAKAMILIGGSVDTLLQYDYDRNAASVAILPKAEAETIRNTVRKVKNMKEATLREMTLFGHNGYYYWESAQYDSLKLIKKMKVPTFIAQGRNDPVVPEEDGEDRYKKGMGVNGKVYTYQVFRGLNHILMNDLTTNSAGIPEYAAETHLDLYAGRALANWILQLFVKK